MMRRALAAAVAVFLSNLYVSATGAPTSAPSITLVPTGPSLTPSLVPTPVPTEPSPPPTPSPSEPTLTPTHDPTQLPTHRPTKAPSLPPTPKPTKEPTPLPSHVPTDEPSEAPTAPSQTPTSLPTISPTGTPAPTVTSEPTPLPIFPPTPAPTAIPTLPPSEAPTHDPTHTELPTQRPTRAPTPVPHPVPTVTDYSDCVCFTDAADQHRPSCQVACAAGQLCVNNTIFCFYELPHMYLNASASNYSECLNITSENATNVLISNTSYALVQHVVNVTIVNSTFVTVINSTGVVVANASNVTIINDVVVSGCLDTPAPSPLPTYQRAGVVLLTGAIPQRVYENSTVSSNFSVSLQEEPLSPVAIVFSSAAGRVRMEPSVARWDYTNYTLKVPVAVVGVDDNIDDGTWNVDYVLSNVSSADDMAACEASTTSRLCHQVATFTGVTVPKQAVRVLDDDYAGLLVTPASSKYCVGGFTSDQGLAYGFACCAASCDGCGGNGTVDRSDACSGRDIAGNGTYCTTPLATACLVPGVNATFDNYGDALKPGTFHVTLLTRPRTPVLVTAGSLGKWVNATPAVLTIAPHNWNASHAIHVHARAQTAARPACASGNRHCDAVADYAFAVTLSVASGDASYADIAVASVFVNAGVRSDLLDPPKVASARFSNLLNVLVVTLDKASDKAGKSGSFACPAVLDLTTAEAVALFGGTSTSKHCSFTSAKVLTVTFGKGATLLPGDVLSLLDTQLTSSAHAASLKTVNETFIVGSPNVPVVPVLTLKPSSVRVGVCDDLTLDGSTFSGSGGRAMTFNFSYVLASGAEATGNASSVASYLHAANAGSGTYKVTLPSAALEPGSSYTFTLTATNFLSETSSQAVTVSKLSVLAPVVRIQGTDPRGATSSAVTRFKASAELPDASCLPSSYALTNSKMSFAWYETTALLFSGEITGTSRNPRLLVLPAYTGTPLTTYTFRVVAFLTDDPNVNNTASVDLYVKQQALMASIAGGATRQIGYASAFTLDATGSVDPDYSSVAFAYAWSCTEDADSSTADCDGLALPGDASAVSVAAADLPVGSYTFAVVVSKGARNATATATVEIVAGSPPVISIADLDAKYNADDGFVLVSASVASTATSYATAWTAPDSDVSYPFRSHGQSAAVVSNRLNVLVKVSALTAGYTYTLRLTATDSDDSESYSEVSLVMNEGPTSGSVAVSPGKGFTFDTAFSFSAINWVDDDLPLTYAFGTTAVDDAGYVDTSTFFSFGDAIPDATLSGVVLSEGAVATNYSVGCFAQALDTYGASGYATAAVRVLPKTLTLEQVLNVSAALVAAAVAENNPEVGRQVLLAANGAIASASDNGRRRLSDNNDGRRSLLMSASEAAAAAVRASNLASLWAVYEVSTITQDDVSSLISVLSGVVDTPAEVTDQVAAEALYFLRAVLVAARDAYVGLSAAGRVNVALSVSNLMATQIFNASEAKSYLYIDNVTAVLGLASSVALYGAAEGAGFGMASGDVDGYAYRTNALDLTTSGNTYGTAVSLSDGGGGNPYTSVAFNVSYADAGFGGGTLSATTVLDVRIVTLPASMFRGFVKAEGGGSDRFADSSYDLSTGNDETFLRSKPTLVEVSLQDATEAIDVSGLATGRVLVTLEANFNFTLDDKQTANFTNRFECITDGETLDLLCPTASQSHTCNFTAQDGVPYWLDYTCPVTYPTCLWWDTSVNGWSSEGCAVASGYSSASVTCACDHLTVFALSANTTAESSTIFPAPTNVPTPAPSPVPTPISPNPTVSEAPTPAPSPLPTERPNVVERWTTGGKFGYPESTKGFITSSSLTFIPAKRCTPTEIIVKFTADFNISSGDKIAVELAGFTSGLCDNEPGLSIEELRDEVESNTYIKVGSLKLYPDSKFLGGYREGQVSKGYQDSRLVFTVKPGAHFRNGSEVIINVDQGNYLKANCGIDKNGNGNFTLSVQAQQLGRWYNREGIPQVATAISNAVINQSTYIPGGCPVTDTRLTLSPPRPKHLSDITVTFRPGMHLNPRDNITVVLGGFTSGNATDSAGYDVAMGKLAITTIVSRYNKNALEYTFKSGSIFNASWTEGVPEVNKPGYNESKIKLMVNPGFSFLPGVQFEVMVSKANKILANCGTAKTYEGIKIRIHVAPDPDYPRASKGVDELNFRDAFRGNIQTVGDGCRSYLGSCHGNGYCDYCTNKCHCNKGFGAPSDVFDRRAKAKDCAGRVCPTGPAFTNFKPTVRLNRTQGGSGESEVGVGGAVEAAVEGRTEAECSGVGTCDYSVGRCQCPPGWAGAACERRTCPGGDANPCSGHGTCLNMKQLALAHESLPLSNRGGFGPPGHYATYGGVVRSPASWDAYANHGCVCDSAWAVGLAANQTQEPEWFGPNCARRHCPSGDDPVTRHVDETDCYNVSAKGDRGRGSHGNVCHVDCSNRGTCDYATGVCGCFEGFFGANCGTPISAMQLNHA